MKNEEESTTWRIKVVDPVLGTMWVVDVHNETPWPRKEFNVDRVGGGLYWESPKIYTDYDEAVKDMKLLRSLEDRRVGLIERKTVVSFVETVVL